MADDEPDGPARPSSRGPRVVTGDMKAQGPGRRAGSGRTATGWAPKASPPAASPPADPPPADPPPADAPPADADASAGDEDLTSETLVGPAPPPGVYQPKRPRVVTGHTAPTPVDEPELSDPGQSTRSMPAPPPPASPNRAARTGPPASSRPPTWAEPEPPAATGAVVPPPVHRSASPPSQAGRPASAAPGGGTAAKPPKPPKTAGTGGRATEPLATKALLLALLSLPLAAIPAVPALVTARRAKRQMATQPGGRGSGKVAAAKVIAVVSLLAWLTVAGVFGADQVRPEGVDYAKLKPGDCIDTPEGTEVRRLKVKACDQPHDAEVFAVLTHPAAEGDAFPGADDLLEYAANECLGQPFTDYVGIPRGQSKLTEFEIVPESEAWHDGRRGLVCAVDNADRSPLTASVKGSAQ
ncbi:MAG TPA: septum formation family protein [Acidimicrobiales bacterium]|nr:septum formation family protein [Acidimicrobiales bacterium]